MRKFLALGFAVLGLLASTSSFALLNLELTRGVAGAVPIAIAPFASDDQNSGIASIVSSDLQTSGRFKVYDGDTLSQRPTTTADVKYDYFHSLGADDLVIGQVHALGGDRYEVSFQLLDVIRGKEQPEKPPVVLNEKFTVNSNQLRHLAHHISDLIYQQALGVKGIFSTRLAYVVVQRNPNGNTRYMLEVADQDGFNPQPLLSSSDPIMSPAWSPNGKQIAYVSFENQRASIYIEDIASGHRRLASQFKGINGAPAWSPDGSRLALVLSKDGSPNIYILSLNTGSLTQVTHDFSINTEPAWSPNGSSMVFTSNRGGGPQIYRVNLSTHAISRVSYDGDYNARASFTADGNHIAMLHRADGIYNIGLLDLNSGSFRLLTDTGTDDESPSIAPNGSMVLYGTLADSHSVLGMVSTDSKVQMKLPAREGDVQDPSWSPFLS